MSETKPKRKHGEGRIFKRGAVAWMQFYDANGNQIRESTKIKVHDEADQNRVDRFLRKRLAEVSEGTRQDTRRMTYQSLRESYFLDCQNKQNKSLRRNKQGKPYLAEVARLDDFFSGRRASQIDADLIRKFTAEEQAKGLANGSINRSISALRRMFHLAVEDDKLRTVPHFPMLAEAKPRKGFFEKPEYDALYIAMPEYLRLPLALGYYTGMRLGEILSLRWNQVDFLGDAIELQAGQTKNDEPRTIPLTPLLKALLVEQHSKRHRDCPFVCFRLDRTGHAVKLKTFRKVWKSRCIKTGLGAMEQDFDRVTGEPVFEEASEPGSERKPKMVYVGKLFHDLRRSGVRNLVRAGVPERVAQDISGHKTRSVFERYNIVSRRDVVDAGKKLAAFLDGDNSGTITQDAKASSL